MTIKTKLVAVLSAILVVFALTIGVTVWALEAQQADIEINEQGAIQVNDQAVPLLMTAKEIKVDVIQVQQWLSDISATRGQDGLDDGFQKAQAFATKFERDIETATKLARTLGYAGIGRALAETSGAFPSYYAAGVRMAKVYVAEGPAAGNRLMGNFDQIAERMGRALDALLTESEQQVGRTLNEAKTISARIQEDNARLIMLLVGCGILGGIIAAGGSVYLFLSLSRSFRGMAEDVEVASGEDMGRPLVLNPDRRDEFGPVARALRRFRDSRIEAGRLAEAQRREEAERAARAKRIEDLCKAFDITSSEAVRAVASAATEMTSSSQAMSATAEETTRQASAVAAASEQASANVQTVASAAEELSSSIAEISRQVTQASRIAATAVTEAERTNAKVQGLAQAANKIGEVVALITDIADQTNLLALNATIEAARAGEAGKGFAVVASEVKNLANQTAKATDEIGAQIAGIQAATREAVSAIEAITKTIAQVNEVNSGVAAAVEQQGAATQEIARNVEQAAVGTQEVSSNIGGVSQAANDTGAAATQIHSTAADLSHQSETLRAEVDKFLANVRAA